MSVPSPAMLTWRSSGVSWSPIRISVASQLKSGEQATGALLATVLVKTTPDFSAVVHSYLSPSAASGAGAVRSGAAAAVAAGRVAAASTATVNMRGLIWARNAVIAPNLRFSASGYASGRGAGEAPFADPRRRLGG